MNNSLKGKFLEASCISLLTTTKKYPLICIQMICLPALKLITKIFTELFALTKKKSHNYKVTKKEKGKEP